MDITCSNQSIFTKTHICFCENSTFYENILSQYELDTGVKQFIEENYDYLVKLWNRFVRLKVKQLNNYFYYSSPMFSGTGYPPNYIVSLGIILYIKRGKGKNIILHTQRKELIAYFLKKKFFGEFKSIIRSCLVLTHWLLTYFASKMFLKKRKAKFRAVIIHSFHDDSFFQPSSKYITSKIPDLSTLKNKTGYEFLFDINPSFFSIKNLFKFRKYNVVYAPVYLGLFEVAKIFLQAGVFFLRSKSLFKSFYFSVDQFYKQIFFNLIKRKSVTAMMQRFSKDSYYIMPWENRGHQLGIECDLEGKNLIKYQCGLLSKVSPEYVNYRYLRHHSFALHLAMSKKVREFLLKVIPNRKTDIVKSPRVFKVKLKNLERNIEIPKIIVICPIDKSTTRRMIQSFVHQAQYPLKFKFHPYCPVSIAEDKIERRPLSECLRDYSIAIYEGFTTASMEAYLSGLSVYRLYNPNRISFDTMDNISIKTIKSLDEIEICQPSIAENLENDYMGISESSFEEYVEKLLETK